VVVLSDQVQVLPAAAYRTPVENETPPRSVAVTPALASSSTQVTTLFSTRPLPATSIVLPAAVMSPDSRAANVSTVGALVVPSAQVQLALAAAYRAPAERLAPAMGTVPSAASSTQARRRPVTTPKPDSVTVLPATLISPLPRVTSKRSSATAPSVQSQVLPAAAKRAPTSKLTPSRSAPTPPAAAKVTQPTAPPVICASPDIARSTPPTASRPSWSVRVSVFSAASLLVPSAQTQLAPALT